MRQHFFCCTSKIYKNSLLQQLLVILFITRFLLSSNASLWKTETVSFQKKKKHFRLSVVWKGWFDWRYFYTAFIAVNMANNHYYQRVLYNYLDLAWTDKLSSVNYKHACFSG